MTSIDDAPLRRITGFHRDDEGHWVAELECGHTQHMRHQPPWQMRPWVQSAEGRERFVGTAISCVRCRSTAARDPTMTSTDA